jgi:hypothetical protein
VEEGKPQAAA